MNTHYSFGYSDDKLVYASPSTGTTRCSGTYVIRVPSSYEINPTSDTAVLVAADKSAIMLQKSSFPNIVHDELLDTSKLDLSSKSGAHLGAKKSTCLLPDFGYFNFLKTLSFPLPAPPTLMSIKWETFEYSNVDDKTLPYKRSYVEASSADISAEIELGDMVYYAVTNGGVFSVPLGPPGTTFSLKFSNNTPTRRIYLGAWSVFY